MTEETKTFWVSPSGRIHTLRECSGGPGQHLMRRVTMSQDRWQQHRSDENLCRCARLTATWGRDELEEWRRNVRDPFHKVPNRFHEHPAWEVMYAALPGSDVVRERMLTKIFERLEGRFDIVLVPEHVYPDMGDGWCSKHEDYCAYRVAQEQLDRIDDELET